MSELDIFKIIFVFFLKILWKTFYKTRLSLFSFGQLYGKQHIFVAKGIDLEFFFCVIFSAKIGCLVVAEIYEMCRLVLAVLKFVTFSAIAPAPRGLLRPASIQLSNLISTFSLGVRHPTK